MSAHDPIDLALDGREGPAKRADDDALDAMVLGALDEVMPERRRPKWLVVAAAVVVLMASGGASAAWVYRSFVAEVGSGSGSGVQSDSVADSDADADADSVAGSDSVADADADSVAGSDSVAESGSDSVADSDSDSVADSESDSVADPDADADADADSVAGSDPGTRTGTGTRTGRGPYDEAFTDLDIDAAPGPRARRRARVRNRIRPRERDRTRDPDRNRDPDREGAGPDALLQRANALRAERRYGEAERTYLAVVDAAPRSDAAYVALVAAAGLRAERLGAPSGAVTLYRRAARLRPNGSLDAEVLYGIADAHRRRGDDDAERDALDALLKKHADSIYAARARLRREALTP
ncbi:MAG: tetratricopeptide repeat protein [Deltaproteobacteria bacterium]